MAHRQSTCCDNIQKNVNVRAQESMMGNIEGGWGENEQLRPIPEDAASCDYCGTSAGRLRRPGPKDKNKDATA